MKAFLLAAGYGTRLKPITDTIPKCMIPIRMEPLLAWWFELLRTHGVTDVMVNTHYLPKPVRNFMDEYNKYKTGLTAYESYEPELLGSGGTVRDNREFVAEEESFLICYADVLTDSDLTEFKRFHSLNDGILSVALFHTNVPEQCGIATIDRNRCIVNFREKPFAPRSNLANAGMYIARQDIFDYLPNKQKLDFGKDVMPQLLGKMYGWQTDGYVIDTGTLKNYIKANEEWKYGYYKNTFKN